MVLMTVACINDNFVKFFSEGFGMSHRVSVMSRNLALGASARGATARGAGAFDSVKLFSLRLQRYVSRLTVYLAGTF